MKPFEFVLVIISVVFGLSLTECAVGFTYIVVNYETVNLYLPHIGLLLLGFLSCLNYWGSIYKLRKVTTWTVPNVGVLFITVLCFYMLTQICFPDPNGFDQDYEKYFNAKIGTILITMICFSVSFIVELLTIRKTRQLKRYSFLLVYILAMASGVVIKNNEYRAYLILVLVIGQLYYMYSTKVLIEDK